MPLGSILAAAVLSTILCWIVGRVATRQRAVVPPRADRWHQDPTPTFGGIGIAAATLVVAGATTAWTGAVEGLDLFLPVVAGSLALFVLGYIDDRLQLSPIAKLVWSLTIGAVLVFTLGALESDAAPWLQMLLAVTAIIWFGGAVHAFNLLDNMDGLAGGIGAISALTLMLVFQGEIGAPLAILLASLAGALAGFLVWNSYPSRLFMGDCGSLFVGGVVAAASLAIVRRPLADLAHDSLVVLLALTVPLFDTGFVLVLRRLAGRKASRGGTDHVSHRLVSRGLTERSAVMTLYGLAVAGGLLAYVVHRDGAGATVPLWALFGIATLLVGIYLARVPAYNGEDFIALQKASFAPFLKDVTFRWHAAEILLDIVLIAVVYYASYVIRFEDERFEIFIPSFTASLPIVIGCKLAALYLSGLYSRLWGTFGLQDLFTVVRGVALGSAASVLVAAYLYRFERFSRGVFIIDAALLTLAIVATRGSFRMMAEAAISRNSQNRRVLIYGAGAGGQLLVREMRTNPLWRMHPIAFVDDDPVKYKRRILGVPVKGTFETLPDLLRRYTVDEVVLSSISINGTKELEVREMCARRGIPVRRLYLELR
jgi:UDP-GlcNAc:undecaprenyl-phosphate GlcNAc-1-phosphate transferase